MIHRPRTLVLIAGFLAPALLATAGLTSALRDETHGLDLPRRYTIAHDIGRATVIEITRGPIDPHHRVSVDVAATFSGVDYLAAMKLYEGRDADADGTVETEEWTLVATATVTEDRDTIATISAAHISVASDACRLVIDTTPPGGDYYEQIGEDGLEYENP